MTTKTLTVKEFAAIIGEDYPVAMSLIKLLEKTEQAKKVGKRPAEGGRGKPSDLFEINGEADFLFWDCQQADGEVVSQTEAVEAALETEEKIKSELGVEAVTIG